MSKNKARAAGMTTITFSLPEDEKSPGGTTLSKASLLKRVSRIQERNPTFGISDLVRLAVAFQEKRGWKEIPEAQYS